MRFEFLRSPSSLGVDAGDWIFLRIHPRRHHRQFCLRRGEKHRGAIRALRGPYVAVIDDGRGIGPDKLTDAMRHDSSDPRLRRDRSDLGRFGLGLKTASLSQCRRLTRPWASTWPQQILLDINLRNAT
jgi:hypothetical protein